MRQPGRSEPRRIFETGACSFFGHDLDRPLARYRLRSHCVERLTTCVIAVQGFTGLRLHGLLAAALIGQHRQRVEHHNTLPSLQHLHWIQIQFAQLRP